MLFITISLGSNINPQDNITRTTAFIQTLCTNTKSSSLYHSPSQGFSGADFINTVMIGETDMSLSEFRRSCQIREHSQGKKHNSRVDGYHDRPIDIDILFVDNLTMTEDTRSQNNELILPHPRLHLRDFVLVPLQELIGDCILPHTGKKISDHLLDLSSLSMY